MFPDAVGATPVMPITSCVVEDELKAVVDILLAFCGTDKNARDEDSGEISVTRLLGTGVREREDRIEESCADTHGEKAAQSTRDIVGRIMRIGGG